MKTWKNDKSEVRNTNMRKIANFKNKQFQLDFDFQTSCVGAYQIHVTKDQQMS